MIRIYYITLSFIFISTVLNAQIGNIEFIENKGQWDNHVKYQGDVPGGMFYIRSKGFTVVQHNEQDLEKIHDLFHGQSNKDANGKIAPFVLHSHAYAVDFAGASENLEIVPDKPLDTYNNYFIGNDPSKWAGHCRIYQGITLKNIYPNVDVRYYTDGGRMKYDIIVKPGADLNKIALRFTGADNLEVKNKELVIKTSVGNLRELDPVSYQVENSQRRGISCKYILTGNELRFDVKNYNPREVLVIDPTLIFCSFTGSVGTNWGFTATYGPDGSFFSGGINLQSGFPTSLGAYQTNFAGGNGQVPTDISLMKLSPNGTARIYATYIGGSGNDQPHSLIVDGAGNLIFAGRTTSPDYPLKGGVLIGNGGLNDIVVTKLNAAGSSLIGSRVIGGKGDDGVNITTGRNGVNSLEQNYGDDGRSEVILDGGGNVYVASCTRSNDFPATASAFQPNFSPEASNQQDGVVLKFDPDLSNLLFASYLGGNGDDAAYVLSLAANGNIYVAGGTASTNFPGNKAGTISSSNNGGIDGFVSIINNNGNSIIKSTYLGTSATDQVFGIKFDKFGFPYVTGQTRGAWTIFNVIYNDGNAPQFIAKLQPDLSAYVYSTTFGRAGSPTPNISITAFLVDNCENVYVSGWGGDIEPPTNPFQSSSTNGMPLTPDAIQSTTDGRDFYFFVLKKNAIAKLFGSFYGQSGGFTDHVDGGTSRFDQQGVIYQAVCANCGGGPVFPTTPGVWSTINGAAGGQGCNLAMIKISFDFSGVQAAPQSSINGVPRDTSGCAPLTVDFRDTIANAVTYYWYFGDGTLPNPLITKVPNTSHTYNLPGTYQVMLIAEDSTTCNIRDTAYLHIKVGDLQAILNFNPVKLAPCDSLKFRFDNLSVAPLVRPFTNQSFKWDFGDASPAIVTGTASVFHSYAAPGSYIVKLILQDTAYCNDQDTLKVPITIAPLVKAQFTTPATGCVPYTAMFTNTSIAGQTFSWDFGDGIGTSTAINPVYTYNTTGTYTITLTANDPNTCNLTDVTTVTIKVFNNPVSAFSFVPDPPIENSPAIFTNLSSPDAVNFKWFFGDGDSLLTTSRLAVTHQYNKTGTFTACLVAYNAAGCADSSCQSVRAIVAALVDLPNAFTPNSGDINSKIFVKGFGIIKMKFIIWNRWGQKVFESNDKSNGWDGKYRGVIQPMDVYAYTLEVEFFDGTKTTKKGDITLIR